MKTRALASLALKHNPKETPRKSGIAWEHTVQIPCKALVSTPGPRQTRGFRCGKNFRKDGWAGIPGVILLNFPIRPQKLKHQPTVSNLTRLHRISFSVRAGGLCN